MRKTLAALCLAATYLLVLSGCNSASGGITVDSVQAAIRAGCGIEMLAGPAASTIAALLGVPGIKSVIDIANTVCSGFNAQPPGLAVGEITVMVRGVPVQVHRIH